MQSTQADWFDVRLVCIHHGCQNSAALRVRDQGGNRESRWVIASPPGDWVLYAFGLPSQRPTEGICGEHQHVTLHDGERAQIDVRVQARPHGVYYEMSQGGVDLGAIAFPTNTRVMQFGPGVQPTDAAREAGARVARLFGVLGQAERAP